MRLRELNKQRTREAIVQAALELFVRQGYRATTLMEIARAAGTAPSTLHTYFPVKDDLLFSVHGAVVANAKKRILHRPDAELTISAILAWVESDLPGLLRQYDPQLLVALHELISSDDELRAGGRARLLPLHDLFAAAFANDLERPLSPLYPQAMATVAMRAMEEVCQAWRDWQIHDREANEVTRADQLPCAVAYVRTLLEGSSKVMTLLLGPKDVNALRELTV